MLKKLLVGVSVVCATALFCSISIAQPATAASPATTGIVVDLSQPLPKQFDLTVGQKIVFENGPPASVTAQDTDGQGTLLDARPHNPLNQLAAFEAKRAGAGEVTITYSVQSPGHKPMKPVTIKVAVKAASVEPNITVDMTAKLLPTEVDIVAGQIILFDNTASKATVTLTPKKGLGRDVRALLKPAPGSCGLGKAFKATRVGSGEVTFTATNGSTQTIKVVVHPRTVGFTLSKNALKSIDIRNGQRVSFISRDMSELNFRTTDKQAGDVLTEDKLSGHVRLAPGWKMFCVFTSERAGSGEFTLTWYDIKGAVSHTETISVTVK